MALERPTESATGWVLGGQMPESSASGWVQNTDSDSATEEETVSGNIFTDPETGGFFTDPETGGVFTNPE